MSTRGIYGFRKNGVDKLTYNHFDSYPEGLGANVVDFINSKTIEELNEIYDRIILVDASSIPTLEQIEECLPYCDLSVGSQGIDDWYCLLREAQGDLSVYSNGFNYMIDSQEFIKDSLFCEHGYIINLDTNMLEYCLGFQTSSFEGNRYGTDTMSGYYPCKIIMEFPLNNLPMNVIELMENGTEDDELAEEDCLNKIF